MSLEEKVLEIMRETFGVKDVTTEASQKNCEQWDSLRHLALASELEEVFDLELEPE
jgi:acyl carrier protein